MPMSLKPSEGVDGGDFPRGNLVITGARFESYQYKDKEGKPIVRDGRPVPPSMSCLLTLQGDQGAGVENQAYVLGS